LNEGVKEASKLQDKLMQRTLDNPKATEMEKMLLPHPGIGNLMIRNTRQFACQANVVE
jgi:hypothetical protein